MLYYNIYFTLLLIINFFHFIISLRLKGRDSNVTWNTSLWGASRKPWRRGSERWRSTTSKNSSPSPPPYPSLSPPLMNPLPPVVVDPTVGLTTSSRSRSREATKTKAIPKKTRSPLSPIATVVVATGTPAKARRAR